MKLVIVAFVLLVACLGQGCPASPLIDKVATQAYVPPVLVASSKICPARGWIQEEAAGDAI
jgi:hypothetical protein